MMRWIIRPDERGYVPRPQARRVRIEEDEVSDDVPDYDPRRRYQARPDRDAGEVS